MDLSNITYNALFPNRRLAKHSPPTKGYMATLFIQYKLKADVAHADFENWVRTFDYPNMRGITRVKSFSTYRADKLLFGEGKPSVDYIEVFNIPDIEGFSSADMPGNVVQMVMGAFMGKVENPQFIVAHEVV
jgi:hypothetical protein